MERRKTPALTSPSKVGVLVALMLVVTGLGVSYFITGTFGVTWHWIEANGLSPTQWKFHFAAFVEEMAPLILLVAMLAFASFVLVAGAVRRYKIYVDSGVEYKDLLRSIKSIEDLEDEEKFEQLKQHPELREFLMGIKHRLAARERQSGERERERERRPVEARTPAIPHALATEASLLANALADGHDGLARDLAISIPELKQIERAARQRLANPAPAPVRTDPRIGELESTLERVRGAAGAVRRDADACTAGGREVETAVASLRRTIEAGAVGAPVSTNEVVSLARKFEALADSLATLGEETKRIAIASALQASSGTDNDSIHVAEEVRAIATRFNAVAQQWKETGPALRRTLESASNAADSSERQRAAVAKALAAAAGKATLWGERMVVLVEQLRTLEVTAGTGDRGDDIAAERSRDWGTVDVDTAEESATDAPAARGASSSGDDGFQKQAPAGVFDEEADDETPLPDMPGFEKEKNLFAETQHEPKGEDHGQDETGRFVVDGNHTDVWEGAAAEKDGAHGGANEQEAATEDTDDFLTGPRATIGAKGRTGQAAAPRENDPDLESDEASDEARVATLAGDPDADAVDLYALGAVDYDALLHA